MKKTKSQFALKISAIGLVVFALCFSVYSLSRAWIEPDQSPPNGNIAAPINTSTDVQSKQGSLAVYGAGGYGMFAQGSSYGVYGYETDTGAYGLLGYAGYGGYFNGPVYSNSYFNAPWLCLNGNCISSWPSSNETLQTVTNRGWTTSQPLYTSNYMQAPIFYDANNSGYYLDPNGASRLNYGVFDNVYSYGWMQAPIFYDANDNGYYSDPNGTSRLNYTVNNNVYSYGWMQAPIFYDANDNGYYLDPNWTSSLHYVTANYIHTNVNDSWFPYFNGWNYFRGPTYAFNSPWYDENNSGYYFDPNGTSRLNYGVFDNIYSYGWTSSPIMYDTNDWGYYSDPNGTSRLNYTVLNNSYIYGEENADTVRGRTQLCIGNDCRTSWPAATTNGKYQTSCTTATYGGNVYVCVRMDTENGNTECKASYGPGGWPSCPQGTPFSGTTPGGIGRYQISCTTATYAGNVFLCLRTDTQTGGTECKGSGGGPWSGCAQGAPF